MPFVGDDSINDFPFDEPCYPPTFTLEQLREPPLGGGTPETLATAAFILSEVDVAAPTVVLEPCMNHGLPPIETCRELLAELKPRGVIAGAVETFAGAAFAGRPVVGVHVRHGNGGNILDHRKFWTDPRAALARVTHAITEAVRALAATRGASPVIFLCTDSAIVENVLRRTFPAILTRPKVFRAPGAGELHRFDRAATGREDAAVEMFLLARSDILVRFPPESFFSFWGSVLKPPSDVTSARGPLDPIVC